MSAYFQLLRIENGFDLYGTMVKNSSVFPSHLFANSQHTSRCRVVA